MRQFLIFLTVLSSHILFSQKTERSLSSENWKFKNAKENNWQTATIPGNIHLDLLKNKKILDPYLDENEKKVQWIENENWDYETQFTISKDEIVRENILLKFEGLDTFAEVFLNGKLLLVADNMFRNWDISVKTNLKVGENKLQIRFKSPVVEGKKLAAKIPFQLPESPRSLVRKAQYQFGWDWGPRLVTSGIWKDVKLVFWENAVLENIRVEQKLISDKKADLVFHAQIKIDENASTEDFQITINDKVFTNFQLKKGHNVVEIPYSIQNPKLWQPNGVGKSYLYDFTISLLQKNQILEVKQEKIGLRTIELVQEKDAQGKSFYFKVNGKPLFIKGTNWIPADSFLPRITKEKYQKLVADAKAANMNMIRIWGGGIYEDDEFYKACDENGILVWQDFAFAGSFYPSDESFQKNVSEEVKSQVQRLQNHPSLALWCGNNEVDEAIVNWGYQKQFNYSKEDSLLVWKDYKKIFQEVIPKMVAEVSPKAIYWPSSPSIGWGHKESLTEGDSHYWGVWWGEQPFEMYNEKVPRFASEYGFQGMPSLETTKAMFSGKPDFSLENPVIKAHEKHTRGWEIIQKYMDGDYKIATDFVQYNYVSQLLQARGMQIAIEAHRRNKPYNMGTLIWQLNDCWPVVSWSSIDYLGNWKALQYQAKRSFEPIVILPFLKDDLLTVTVSNDSYKHYSFVRLQTSIYTFKGDLLEQFDETDRVLEENSLLNYHSLDLKQLVKKEDWSSVYLVYSLKDENDNILSTTNYFLAPPKDLQLEKPSITIHKISDTEIEISTDVFAKNVYLLGDAHFSDNFFDLKPKEIKKIQLSKPLSKKVEVLSLWDTMK